MDLTSKPHLKRFIRRLQVLRLLLLAILNGLFMWGAIAGPWQEQIGTSIGATIAFSVLVLVVPWAIVEAFPAPFVKRLPNETAREWLFRERTKTIVLIIVVVVAINIFLQQIGGPAWEGVGFVVVLVGLAWCGWICRRALKDNLTRNWHILTGKEKGGGWLEAKEQICEILRRDVEEENDS